MHDDTLRIHAETCADAARTAILQRLCAQLNDNEVGVIAGDDPECLHDFRVAVRRTRSALGQIKKTLPASIVADYRRRFTRLAGISGPTRDLDVYLLHFDAFRDRLPVELRTEALQYRSERGVRAGFGMNSQCIVVHGEPYSRRTRSDCNCIFDHAAPLARRIMLV